MRASWSESNRRLPVKKIRSQGNFATVGLSGSKLLWTELRSFEEQAPWVPREPWHPTQKITALRDEIIIVELPFTDIRELSMDV